MTRAQAEHYTDAETDPGLPGSSNEFLISLLRQAGRAESRASAKQVAARMANAEIEAFLRGFTTQELLQPFLKLDPEAITPDVTLSKLTGR